MVHEELTNGDLLPPGERWATPDEVVGFWTDRRLDLAARVYYAMNGRLRQEFGGPDVPMFTPKVFLLTATEDSAMVKSSGAHHHQSGWMMLNISDKDDDLWLAEVIAHEIGESRAYRFSDEQPRFTFVNEAVIETTMQQFLYEEWPQLKDDPDPVTYLLARRATTAMCKHCFMLYLNVLVGHMRCLVCLQGECFRVISFSGLFGNFSRKRTRGGGICGIRWSF